MRASIASGYACVCGITAQQAVKNATTVVRDVGWRRTRKHTHDVFVGHQTAEGRGAQGSFQG